MNITLGLLEKKPNILAFSELCARKPACLREAHILKQGTSLQLQWLAKRHKSWREIQATTIIFKCSCLSTPSAQGCVASEATSSFITSSLLSKDIGNSWEGMFVPCILTADFTRSQISSSRPPSLPGSHKVKAFVYNTALY